MTRTYNTPEGTLVEIDANTVEMVPQKKSTIYPDNIPDEIRNRNIWLIWRKDFSKGALKPKKLPYQGRNPDSFANNGNPDTWCDLKTALAMYDQNRADGIGIACIAPYIVLDFDNCIKDGILDPAIQEIVDLLESYTEISQSGNGIHIIGKMQDLIFPEDVRTVIDFYQCEIATSGKFLYLTGDVYQERGRITYIEKRIKKLAELCRDRRPPEERETEIPQSITNHHGSICQNWNLSLKDVIPSFPDMKQTGPGKYQGSHPHHGSTTKWNFSVDYTKDSWYCHHDGHKSGGGPLELFAVMEGIIDCGDVRKGCLDGKWSEVFAALEKRGYKDSTKEKKPIEKEYRLVSPKEGKERLRKYLKKIPGTITERQKATLLSIGKLMRSLCFPEGEIEKKLVELNQNQCVPPLKSEEVQAIYKDALREHQGIPVKEERSEEKKERVQTPKDIHDKAMQVLTIGRPIAYLKKQFDKLHIGDDSGFYGLTASFGCQLAENTDGLQPAFTGKSGGGKTDICLSYFHLLPEEFKRRGSFSNQSFFYEPLETGTVILLDEAQNLPDDIKDLIKQSTSYYQESFTRITVKQQTPVHLTTPARPVYLLTSVDGAFQDQMLNRQLSLTIDETKPQDEAVMEAIIKRYQSGKKKFPETKGVLVCREIWRILKTSPPVNVKISLKFKWKNPENRRNLTMFYDTVAGFAAIMQFQRKRDADGCILATRDDAIMAKDEVWTAIEKEQVSKLTKPQLALIRYILKFEPDSAENTRSLPRQDILRGLKWSDSKLSRAASGIKGEGGLSDKLPGFYITTESRKAGDRVIQYKTYNLVGDFNMLEQFESLVVIEDE